MFVLFEKMFYVIAIFCVSFLSGVCADVSHYEFYEVPLVTAPTTQRPFLPEIIINRKAKDGYNYQPPLYVPPQSPAPVLPPLQDVPLRDEVPAIPQAPDQGYLPPENVQLVISSSESSVDNTHGGYVYNHPTTSTTVRPIFPSTFSDFPSNSGYVYSTPASAYLPVGSERSSKNFDLFANRAKNPIRVHLNEMRCLPHSGGYFRTVLSIESALEAVPVVDTDNPDHQCSFRVQQSLVIIEIPSENFQRCGVNECGNSLCLRIRFPHITGMRTNFDSLLTLQCKSQERVVEKTHSVKVGVSNDEQSRSATAFAQGGSQLPFHSQVAILRKSGNGFSKSLEPHGVVQLGEELMLKAQIRSGDGWNFTKISDIKLQRLSQTGELLNSALLVKSNGCINPTMRSICPVSPSFEPPLGFKFPFRAVMFDGMTSGDEMVLSAKISGCIEQRDCIVHTNYCNSKIPGFLGRSRRSTKSNATEKSEISTITFRVVFTENKPDTAKVHGDNLPVVMCTIFAFICIITLIAIFVYAKLK